MWTAAVECRRSAGDQANKPSKRPLDTSHTEHGDTPGLRSARRVDPGIDRSKPSACRASAMSRPPAAARMFLRSRWPTTRGRLDSDTLLVRWNDKHDGRRIDSSELLPELTCCLT
jgi:hypothetical protein